MMRKFIDILKEFAIDPKFFGGDDGNRTIHVFDIIWDVSPEEEATLPKEITTTLHDVQEAEDPYADEEVKGDLMHQIGDFLTTNYSGNLSNFDYSID